MKVACFAFWCFFWARNLFVKKINRREIVLITWLYYLITLSLSLSLSLSVSFSLWKERTCKPSKETAVKSICSSVCYRFNLLRWMFLPHVIAGRNYFSQKCLLLWGFCNRHVSAFFDASAFKKPIFHTSSPQ